MDSDVTVTSLVGLCTSCELDRAEDDGLCADCSLKVSMEETKIMRITLWSVKESA